MTEDTKKPAEEVQDDDLDQAEGGLGFFKFGGTRGETITASQGFDIIGETPPIKESFTLVGKIRR